MSNQWISVDAETPEISTDKNKVPVIAITILGITSPVFYYGKTKDSDPCNGWSIMDVTYWLPQSALPEPPKTTTT